MNCPHCGAGEINRWFANGKCALVYECGAEFVGHFQKVDTLRCAQLQITQLKAELEQRIRRDDPRLKEALRLLEDASYGTVNWQDAATSAKQLQSIIEGK